MKVFIGNIEKNKKQVPQYLRFRCGMTHLNCSLRNLGTTLKLQKEFLKTERNRNEIDYNNYKDKKDEWLDYVKQDILCTAFGYARYCKAMRELAGFSMKDSLSVPGLGWRDFISLRDESDEPIYSFNDKYMRWFVQQRIKEDAYVILINIINRKLLMMFRNLIRRIKSWKKCLWYYWSLCEK